LWLCTGLVSLALLLAIADIRSSGSRTPRQASADVVPAGPG